jgi:hypothetical protein
MASTVEIKAEGTYQRLEMIQKSEMNAKNKIMQLGY